MKDGWVKRQEKEIRKGQTIGKVVNKPLCILSDTKMQYQMLQYYEHLKVYLIKRQLPHKRNWVIEGKLILGIVGPECIMSVYVLRLRELPGDK